MAFAIDPPVEPMLARLADTLPAGEFLYEPKWDGFRAVVFRGGGEVYIQSRDSRPLDRYFPELHDALRERLPARCVVDGEIVIAGPRGLEFDALQLRLHPAASRVAKLAKASPASFVAFDLLASEGEAILSLPQCERRVRLEKLLHGVEKPVYLTPVTRDHARAERWLQRFEGAGLDGVIAKPTDLPYLPGKRAMIKVKHARTADCVLAGFRWYKGTSDAIGSLILGLYDEQGTLHHVGVTSSFTMQRRRDLAKELEPLRTRARLPGSESRWSAGKDVSWEELRPERVCEVKYDHLQGDRFRHAATFLRWRPDKSPRECTYAQLEVIPPFDLEKIFSGSTAATARRLVPGARKAR